MRNINWIATFLFAQYFFINVANGENCPQDFAGTNLDMLRNASDIIVVTPVDAVLSNTIEKIDLHVARNLKGGLHGELAVTGVLIALSEENRVNIDEFENLLHEWPQASMNKGLVGPVEYYDCTEANFLISSSKVAHVLVFTSNEGEKSIFSIIPIRLDSMLPDLINDLIPDVSDNSKNDNYRHSKYEETCSKR